MQKGPLGEKLLRQGDIYHSSINPQMSSKYIIIIQAVLVLSDAGVLSFREDLGPGACVQKHIE